jgi:uncharacterized protein YjbJ (UPF0337 family)
MNKDQIKGKLENLKGRVKEAFGTATGDKEKEAGGLVDRAKGAAEEKLGDAKDAVEGATKREAQRADFDKGDLEPEDD